MKEDTIFGICVFVFILMVLGTISALEWRKDGFRHQEDMIKAEALKTAAEKGVKIDLSVFNK